METVNIKRGEVVLRKPLAGQRNKALIKAETRDGFKTTIYYTELLPECVHSHPFGSIPIKSALDSLQTDEYDLILDVLKNMLELEVDAEKKSEKPSESDMTPEVKVTESK